ncbi:hypothetical protein BT96DRAFT_1027086 [Gymnopus androsaceus JB14]|uniref:Uncharacterized protein n=1 Tax=Gymnopus androsaceus JB14 TaxID=1447944 RepID=A0A6A4GDZ1_9AGAR|nr:hypothetical protein BT96DRAFT_1027086 [Gymnopus androsaceus JB14]
MNHKKLNKIFKRNYQASSGAMSDDSDAYEPSQVIQTIKKRRHDASSPLHPQSSPLPPRPSALAAREANEELANTHYLDDDVGSQKALEELFIARGLDPALLLPENTDYKDGASDIDQQEYYPESQKPELYGSSPPSSPVKQSQYHIYRINVEPHNVYLEEDEEGVSDFCPHSHEACPCAAWLFQQQQQLNECLRHEWRENEEVKAKNFQLKIRLERTQETLRNTLNLLNSSDAKELEWLKGIEAAQKGTEEALKAARQEVEEAHAARKAAEQRIELANSVRRDIIRWVQPPF